MAVTFILGGARSGKSAYAQIAAETLIAERPGQSPVMIVTAQALDAEMSARIARHQADRDEIWRTVEAPRDLSAAVAGLTAGDVAVIDCLTLWLSNLMLDETPRGAPVADFLEALKHCPADLFVISNEVGQGIVPDNALARRFRDEAGRLHQQVARIADQVMLITAGLPLRLKG